ncbi:TPA: hypothetical protein ACPJ1A_004502 [Vibrio diabolicus]
MNKLSLPLIILATALTGCGGGDSSSNAAPMIKKDGIYINKQDLVVALVDTDRSEDTVIIGDYVNNEIFSANTKSIKGNTLITKDVMAISAQGRNIHPELELSFNFSETGMSASGVIDNQHLVYSFSRATSSLPLSDMIGSHVDTDGSQLIITEDGSITANSKLGCTINGKIQRHKFYYTVSEIDATQCTDPLFNNNNYEGILLTADYDDKTYLLSIIANQDGNVLWGSIPISF